MIKYIKLPQAQDVISMLTYIGDEKHPAHIGLSISEEIVVGYRPPPALHAQMTNPPKAPPSQRGRKTSGCGVSIIYRSPDSARLTAEEKGLLTSRLVNHLPNVQIVGRWHTNPILGCDDLHLVMPASDKFGKSLRLNPLKLKAIENKAIEDINIARDLAGISRIQTMANAKAKLRKEKSQLSLAEQLANNFKGKLKAADLESAVKSLGYAVPKATDKYLSVAFTGQPSVVSGGKVEGGKVSRFRIDLLLKGIEESRGSVKEPEKPKPKKGDPDRGDI